MSVIFFRPFSALIVLPEVIQATRESYLADCLNTLIKDCRNTSPMCWLSIASDIQDVCVFTVRCISNRLPLWEHPRRFVVEELTKGCCLVSAGSILAAHVVRLRA